MLLGYIANIRPKIKKIGGRCFAKITINIPFEEEKKIHYPVHELLITPLSDLRKELVKKASQEGCYINASLEPAHTTNFQPGDSVRIEARIEGIWVN